MGYYKCECCGKVFSEEDLVEESYWDDRGDGYSEHLYEYYCPECGSDNIEEWDNDFDAQAYSRLMNKWVQGSLITRGNDILIHDEENIEDYLIDPKTIEFFR